jgi:hypothetical protein
VDELTSLLLSQIAGTGEAGPPMSLPDLVEQSLGDDPMAAPLAAALRQRAASAAAAEARIEEADAEVADVLERLYAEVEGLRERARTLADALGACATCFGDDELCPVCRGRGRPGGRAPDEALFAELVEPAWRRRTGRLAVSDLLVPADGSVHRP